MPAQIERLNGQRQLTIRAEVTGDLVAVARRLDRRFADLKLPPGYSVTCTGRYRVLLTGARELLFVLLWAGLLILAIMTLEFGSMRQAAWILAVVPVSLAGGAFGLALTGAGLNVAAATGMLTLLGIAVNNGIVLLGFANRLRAAGADPASALRASASIRLRPILATTLTTIAGLGVGTLATLVVLPAAVLRRT